MQFFSFIPIINYDNYTIRNLFYKYYFANEIPEKYLYDYILKENECLESISFDVYNNSVFWYILAMINNIRDIIFDLPLSTSILQKIATEESTVAGVLDLVLFSENYDQLEIENDLKRNIKILKPEFLNNILTNFIKEI